MINHQSINHNSVVKLCKIAVTEIYIFISNHRKHNRESIMLTYISHEKIYCESILKVQHQVDSLSVFFTPHRINLIFARLE